MRRHSSRDMHEPLRLEPLQVEARPGEATERLIKRFSRMVRDDGVIRDHLLKRSHEKPCQKRRRKRAAARYRAAGK